ncbi:UPF0331 protein YutE [Pullulanibacillus camelliae]|uniref:UPF0331 protein YutE n=1 Tax=Pullulanibacillus camelliae TaxID=1707096 RepID=A0A8J2YKD1_9BACL|nr:DUF86 domain-containing protein [Pullulanibacillus camelliae]GGE48533.1 UPF0331 protein YutE [Pullulanibacillus camelliae]
MYFVDRQRIEQILQFMSEQMELMASHQSWESSFEKRALERLVHVVVESILDVGNQMIDGFIMRDPGSYEDIVDILVDEQVLPKEKEDAFKAIVKWRKALVQHYDTMDHQGLLELIAAYLAEWQAFPICIRDYLERELGPVSAFKPTANN